MARKPNNAAILPVEIEWQQLEAFYIQANDDPENRWSRGEILWLAMLMVKVLAGAIIYVGRCILEAKWK